MSPRGGLCCHSFNKQRWLSVLRIHGERPGRVLVLTEPAYSCKDCQSSNTPEADEAQPGWEEGEDAVGGCREEDLASGGCRGKDHPEEVELVLILKGKASWPPISVSQAGAIGMENERCYSHVAL